MTINFPDIIYDGMITTVIQNLWEVGSVVEQPQTIEENTISSPPIKTPTDMISGPQILVYIPEVLPPQILVYIPEVLPPQILVYIPEVLPPQILVYIPEVLDNSYNILIYIPQFLDWGSYVLAAIIIAGLEIDDAAITYFLWGSVTIIGLYLEDNQMFLHGLGFTLLTAVTFAPGLDRKLY